MTDDELSRDEEQALSAMKRDIQPPLRIEDAVVAALKREGRIASRRRWMPSLIVAAAVVAAFVAGTIAPRMTPLPPATAQPRFAILLYPGAMPADSPSRREEYAAWARHVAMGGMSISGEELGDDAADPAGPRGFFIVSARDADAAKAIASTCPHVKYGGRVVVRRIAS